MDPPPASQPKAPEGCKLFVGGLPREPNQRAVLSAFERFGRVTDKFFARAPPGFAFITLESPEAATAAVAALDNTEIAGARVRVQVSTRGDKPPRPREMFGLPPRGARTSDDRDYGRGGRWEGHRDRSPPRHYRDERDRSPPRYRDDRSPPRYRNERSPPRYRDDRSPPRYRSSRSPPRYRDDRSPPRGRDSRYHRRSPSPRGRDSRGEAWQDGARYRNERPRSPPRRRSPPRGARPAAGGGSSSSSGGAPTAHEDRQLSSGVGEDQHLGQSSAEETAAQASTAGPARSKGEEAEAAAAPDPYLAGEAM